VWYIPDDTVTVDQDDSGDGKYSDGDYIDAWPASLSGSTHGSTINAVRIKIE